MKTLALELSKKLGRPIPEGEIPLDDIALMRFPANGFSHSSGNETIVYSPSLDKFFERDEESDEDDILYSKISYREISKHLAQIKVLYAQKSIRPKMKENCRIAGLFLHPKVDVSTEEETVVISVDGNDSSPFFFKEGKNEENLRAASEFLWLIARDF